MPRHSDPSPKHNEALAGLLGLGSQSARKSHYPQLQERLQELETERNRYKWLFEHAVHGIFQANMQHGLLSANPALARMLGYDDPQQVLWSLSGLAKYLFIGGAAELLHIEAELNSTGALLAYETQLRRRDGSVIEVLMNLLLKPDEAGLFEGFVADITARKQAELRMQQLNDELEQRVSARTAELEQANHNLRLQIAERERIEQALREARDTAQAANLSKDKYLAAASHDLLQPLNAARLLISTLRERSLPASEQNLVERSHQALEGAEDLLADLLDISRLDQAAIKADIDTYSLAELFEPLASEFEPLAAAAGLRLRVRGPDVAISTDLRLLTRILRNFLSNACRYTQQGGILLGARRRGNFIDLQVCDSGCGIAQDQLQAIFLEFNQLNVERAAERKGVGLGLAIVERIAGILGYTIKVRSQPGRGSTFSIRVPLAKTVRAPLTAQPKAAPLSLGDPLPGRRLLVIDNELSILHSMSALLEQWGCTVLTASDYTAALQALDGQAPELILADYHLDQGLIGCTLVEQLRQHFAQPIATVIISADRSDECRRQLAQLGMPLLNKPVKPGKLRAVLSQLLQSA
ncbi:NahK/ErcS family hybrid sensor histidine kinase/response regulator [Pseudomonas sp. 5P_3.1_Bac2]|uniref:PAS domain-containing hybrid sensor histidine kinase/response regulator n=1 Tax=Pseudomonas sp. 5P_3.1_Bac2 TaxID=2971617 RepID=UPI0021C57512|nr:NahK/ErcS family hybrid sensor histidine kinase/response regulator [Pseudomonas sp. 5P_3.1_Bac2]MCU1717395.1 ATP-binding protein [Pseudomonas sp. 5P_3.1_Bac2]